LLPKYANNGGWRAEQCEYFRIRATVLTIITSMGSRSTESERNLATEIGLARWPNNGLRHSFASYHLAKHQNAPRLALEMGHSTPRMVFDNYREAWRRRKQKGTGSFTLPLWPTISSRFRPQYEPQGGAITKTIKVKIYV
jgi:hypothetical protein